MWWIMEVERESSRPFSHRYFLLPSLLFSCRQFLLFLLVSNSKKKSGLDSLKHDHFIETTYTLFV